MSLRIAVTGLGAIAPNGHSVGEFWAACLAGRSGIRRLAEFDAQGLDVDIGGEIRDFDPSPYFTRRDRALYDVMQLLSAAAARMAVEDAALGCDPDRLGVVVGTAAGPLATQAGAALAFARNGRLGVRTAAAPAGSVSLCASAVAKRLGARGPTFSPSGACATASFAVIAGAHLLAAGDADAVVAGAADAMRTPWIFASFGNMRALARHPEPERASRPLSVDRNGFVIGEGAAAFVLEPLARAEQRGARIYGVLSGYGMTSDAGDVMAASADGIARSCRLALAKAGLDVQSIDHVNLHASGTRQGDQAEADALHATLGASAARIPVTAPKSLIGHAMGAAAGLETVLLLKTLETGLIPPTINLERPDPALRLNASAEPRRGSVDVALKTAFGVGGVNAALVFERHPSV